MSSVEPMVTPVTMQPVQDAGTLVAAGGGCPPGLEPFLQLNQIFIKQDVEMFEAIVGFETENRYKVLTGSGGLLFKADEDTNCCNRMCCGSNRSFTIWLSDNLGQRMMKLESPFRSDSCWCPCWLKCVEVQCPPGNTIGYVQQSWSLCKPAFYIQNAEKENILRIQGPCLPKWELCGDRVFQVYTADGETPCGQVTKQWSGLVKELFTDADTFGVSFPVDLDVSVKATIMASAFLIDFMFFEDSPSDDNPVY